MQENVPENALIYIGTFKLRQYLHREVRPAANTLFLSVLRNSLYASRLYFYAIRLCHSRFTEKAFSGCGKGFFALQNMLSRMPEKAVLNAERGFPVQEKADSD